MTLQRAKGGQCGKTSLCFGLYFEAYWWRLHVIFQVINILTASCFKYTWQVSLRCSRCVSSSAILQHNKRTSNVLLDFVISKTCNPPFPPSLIVPFLPDFSHSLSSLAPNQQIYMTAPSLLVEAGTKRSAAARSLIKDSYRTICMHETKGFWLPTAQPSHCWAVWGAGSSLWRGEQGHDGPVESTVWQWCQAVPDQKKKNKKKQVNVSFLNFQKGRKFKKEI